MTDPARIAFDLIDEFNKMTQPTQVFDRMSEVLRGFGFTSFLIGIAPESATDVRQLLWLNGLPREWSALYAKEKYFQDDPVVNWTRQSANPFDWSDVPERLLRKGRAQIIMDTAADFGLKKGIVIPIFRGDSPVAGVSISGERPDLDARVRTAVHLIGMYAFGSIAALRDTTDHRPVLNDGEIEVLAWIRDGKTSPDIAEILGITLAAVDWRLKRAADKLNAVNRTHAVVQAIRRRALRVQ